MSIRNDGSSGSESFTDISSGNINSGSLYLQNDSVIAGEYAGLNLITNTNIIANSANTIIGKNAGVSLQKSYNNTFLGYLAGFDTQYGSNNIFIGKGVQNNYLSWTKYENISIGNENSVKNNSITVGNRNIHDANAIVIGQENNVSRISDSILIGNKNKIWRHGSNNNNLIMIGNHLMSNKDYDINIGDTFMKYPLHNSNKLLIIGLSKPDNTISTAMGYSLQELEILEKKSHLSSFHVKHGINTDKIELENDSGKSLALLPPILNSNFSFVLPSRPPKAKDVFLTSDTQGNMSWNTQMSLDSISDGTSNKFIQNGVLKSDLYIQGTLIVNRLNILGNRNLELGELDFNAYNVNVSNYVNEKIKQEVALKYDSILALVHSLTSNSTSGSGNGNTGLFSKVNTINNYYGTATTNTSNVIYHNSNIVCNNDNNNDNVMSLTDFNRIINNCNYLTYASLGAFTTSNMVLDLINENVSNIHGKIQQEVALKFHSMSNLIYSLTYNNNNRGNKGRISSVNTINNYYGSSTTNTYYDNIPVKSTNSDIATIYDMINSCNFSNFYIFVNNNDVVYHNYNSNIICNNDNDISLSYLNRIINSCNYLTNASLGDFTTSNMVYDIINSCNYITSHYSNEILDILNTCNYVSKTDVVNIITTNKIINTSIYSQYQIIDIDITQTNPMDWGIYLTGDHTCYTFGNSDTYNQNGNSNIPTNPQVVLNTRLSAPVQNIVQVACGWFHTLMLESSGYVLACGWNISGQCGQSIEETLPETPYTEWKNINVPMYVRGIAGIGILGNIKKISCDSHNSIFLDKYGNALSCGESLGVSTEPGDLIKNIAWTCPRYILKGEQIDNTGEFLQNIVDIFNKNFFIDNTGKCLTYYQSYGAPEHFSYSYDYPRMLKYIVNSSLEKIDDIISISSLHYQTYYLTKSGNVLASGINDNYQCTYDDIESNELWYYPRPLRTSETTLLSDIIGISQIYFLHKNGDVYISNIGERFATILNIQTPGIKYGPFDIFQYNYNTSFYIDNDLKYQLISGFSVDIPLLTLN